MAERDDVEATLRWEYESCSERSLMGSVGRAALLLGGLACFFAAVAAGIELAAWIDAEHGTGALIGVVFAEGALLALLGAVAARLGDRDE